MQGVPVAALARGGAGIDAKERQVRQQLEEIPRFKACLLRYTLSLSAKLRTWT
jgi:hypothetical protein